MCNACSGRCREFAASPRCLGVHAGEGPKDCADTIDEQSGEQDASRYADSFVELERLATKVARSSSPFSAFCFLLLLSVFFILPFAP